MPPSKRKRAASKRGGRGSKTPHDDTSQEEEDDSKSTPQEPQKETTTTERAQTPTADMLDDTQPKHALISNLRLTHEYLKRQGQSPEAAARLQGVAGALVREQLMASADRDVRLLVACCLADVVRVFAPEPPYGEVNI